MDKKSLIGQGLMIIAGSDQEITPPEMSWLHDVWLEDCQNDQTEAVYDLLLRFNYREETLENFFAVLTDVLTESEKNIFIYNAVKMASSDNIYADEEKEAIKTASQIFELKPDLVSAIESLVEMEAAVEITKNAILG